MKTALKFVNISLSYRQN